MDPQIILYYVVYYCDGERVAERGPTLLRPYKDDLVMFSKDDDTYVAEMFTVLDVVIVVPESDAEVVRVEVQLEAND